MIYTKNILELYINGFGDSSSAYQLGFQDSATKCNLSSVFIKKLNIFFYQCNLYFKKYIHDVLTISSFLILPPESFSKKNILIWLLDHCQNSIFLTGCFLAEIMLLLTAFLGFSLIYIWYKKDSFFLDRVVPYYKKLSTFRKITFLCFTMFTAIPNKFWVNQNIHSIIIFIISCFVYLLGLIFPIIFFCYFMYLVLCFESFLFGWLYDNSSDFRKIINFAVFGNSSELFAEDYFNWFWGNMWRRAVQKAKAVAAGAVVIESERQVEIIRKIRYADKQTNDAERTLKGFETPEERRAFQKKIEEDWIDDNGTVTKIIKEAEKWFSS